MIVLAFFVFLLFLCFLLLLIELLRWGIVLSLTALMTFFLAAACILSIEGAILGIITFVREKRGTPVSKGFRRCAVVLLAVGLPLFVVSLALFALVVFNVGTIMGLTGIYTPGYY